jgi:hypothetical protein
MYAVPVFRGFMCGNGAGGLAGFLKVRARRSEGGLYAAPLRHLFEIGA